MGYLDLGHYNFLSLENAITIRLFGDLPLQVHISLIRAIFYVCRPMCHV
jgi:hypothetical protein